MSDFIGPALPPHLQKKLEVKDETTKHKPEEAYKSESLHDSSLASVHSEISKRDNEEVNVQNCEIGPSLPSHFRSVRTESTSSQDATSIGPALPPHLRKRHSTESSTGNEGNEDVLVLHADISDEESYSDEPKDLYGPVLPPSLSVGPQKPGKNVKKFEMGPSLPPGMKIINNSDKESSDSDTDIVGPMPVSDGCDSESYIQAQLNERAMRMKRKLAEEEGGSSGPMKRESWMLELPPDRAADFGLGPRQFRARAKPDSGDRSVWTDTPADRLKKEHSKDEKSDKVSEMELKVISERDRAMERLVEEHTNKKRKESLLEKHQKELKKKKKKEKEEGKKEERRPFDRDIDLQANRFDEAQKKAIFKKAQLLNDRFSSGQSKFL